MYRYVLCNVFLGALAPWGKGLGDMRCSLTTMQQCMQTYAKYSAGKWFGSPDTATLILLLVHGAAILITRRGTQTGCTCTVANKYFYYQLVVSRYRGCWFRPQVTTAPPDRQSKYSAILPPNTRQGPNYSINANVCGFSCLHES